MVDESDDRYGQPSWHKRPDVGMAAVNDAYLMKSAVFSLLDRYFYEKSSYVHLTRRFHQTMYVAAFNEVVDLLVTESMHSSCFNGKMYERLASAKMSFGVLMAPFEAGMHFAG